MPPGPHVFEDGRIGLWIVNSDNLTDRLPKIRRFANGMITDLFLPRTATRQSFQFVRDSGFFGCHLWVAVDGLSANDYAQRTVDDIVRLGAGATDLNIELGQDDKLQPFMRTTLSIIRQTRPNYRLRLNVAPYKGQFVPMDLVQGDPNLYVGEQTYYGDMSRVSEGEALQDLLEWGCPLRKASLVYGAAALVPNGRVVGLGTLWTWSNGAIVRGLRRGVIFQDDLMTDVGLL